MLLSNDVVRVSFFRSPPDGGYPRFLYAKIRAISGSSRCALCMSSEVSWRNTKSVMAGSVCTMFAETAAIQGVPSFP